MPDRTELSRIASLQSRLDKAERNLNRMVEAFEHLESGVVLYGTDDRMVFCNRRFREPDDTAITRGIFSLAKSLGMRVVAEGVEHNGQLNFLLAVGCEEAQGNLLSRPLPPQVLQENY